MFEFKFAGIYNTLIMSTFRAAVAISQIEKWLLGFKYDELLILGIVWFCLS